MANDNDIKKLTEYNALLSQVLQSKQALAEEVGKYFEAFGQKMEGTIETAGAAKEKLEQLINLSVNQNNLNSQQATVLQNIKQLMNSNLQINNEKVLLDQKYNNILEQNLRLLQLQLKSAVQSNIEAGKNLNFSERIRVQREQIANLTKEEARYAALGLVTQNKIGDMAVGLIGKVSAITAELNRMTSDSGRYASIVLETADAISGVSYDESLAAQKELISGLSGYTRMSREQQKAISENTVLFEKLGLSSKNQALFTEMATKSFGMSAKESTNFMRELQSFSESANIPMSEIDKNMGALGEKMALFGRANYQQVFKDLTAAAKDFGIEASKMLDVTEKFTTFEGAAQAAGRLNAILGGNFVSGLRLMNSALEDPVDVFRQLKTAMDTSGKEFENMSQAQKRYVAEKIGVSVAEAEKLFGQSLNESTQSLKEKQKTQKELAEIAEKSTAVFQRLEIAFQKIVNSPLIGWTVKVIERFANFIELISKDNMFGATITGIIGLIAGFSLLSKAILFIFGPFMSVLKFFGLLKISIFGKTAALSAQTTALAANTAALAANEAALVTHNAVSAAAAAGSVPLSAGATLAAAGMVKLGVALLLVGASIGIVILSIAAMAGAFALWNEAQARNTEATTKQAQVFSELAMTIKEMPTLKSNLESFAQGISKIADAINEINLQTIRELNSLTSRTFSAEFMTSGTATVKTEVIPVKVVEVEMSQQQNREMMKPNSSASATKEVKLNINSPLTIEGADFGRLVYNGIAVYQESTTKEITPAVSMYTTNQLMNWHKGG